MKICRTGLALGLVVVLGGCASTTDGGLGREFFHDVYWAVASECEGRYRTLHVERIATDGGLSVSAAANSRIEAADFRNCYWSGVTARVERRRAAGLPVPPDVNLHPGIDID